MFIDPKFLNTFKFFDSIWNYGLWMLFSNFFCSYYKSVPILLSYGTGIMVQITVNSILNFIKTFYVNFITSKKQFKQFITYNNVHFVRFSFTVFSTHLGFYENTAGTRSMPNYKQKACIMSIFIFFNSSVKCLTLLIFFGQKFNHPKNLQVWYIKLYGIIVRKRKRY